jgi:hypothetical protein
MVIAGIAWGVVLTGLLSVFGGVAVLVLVYRALLFIMKGPPSPIKYAVLSTLTSPVSGVIAFEYELPESGGVKLELIETKSKTTKVLFDGSPGEGTHEILFDTSEVANGEYHYKLITHNQGTTKKLVVRNN